MTGEEARALVIPILLGILAMCCFIFAFLEQRTNRKMKHLSGEAKGTITGLLRSHLFRNDIEGDVPGKTEAGWGVAQGEQRWGGALKFWIPPWFPCVHFEAAGKEYTKLVGEGAWKGTWKIGQEVTVLFDNANPNICTIKGDTSVARKIKQYLWIGILMTAACVISMLVLF